MEEKSWEEEMYWKHFHTMHFYQFLPTDFHHHLVLPAKFAEYMSSKLPQKVSLIGPSGAAWDVEVAKNGCLSLIGDGWKGFIEAYALEENCLLLFKYKYDSSFEILIFDQESLCEKEAAYFVHKCLEKKPDHKNGCKGSGSNASSTKILEDDDADGGSQFGSTKKQKKDVVEEVVCKGHRSNGEATNKSPSDSSFEDQRNDPDFVVSGELISPQDPRSGVSKTAAARAAKPRRAIVSPKSSTKFQSARKPTKNDTAKKSEKSIPEQIPLLTNGQMEVTEGLISASPSKSDVSPDVIFTAVALGDGKSHPKTKSTQKTGTKRGRPVILARPISSKKLAFGKDKLSGNNTSAELGQNSDMEQIPLRNGPMEVTEGVFSAIASKSDISPDVISMAVSLGGDKCHLGTKSTQRAGRKRGVPVKLAHLASAKKSAFGKANVAADKLCGNNTSAELGQSSDIEQIPLRNCPMEVTEGVTLATPCKSDVSPDVTITEVVTPDNGKSHPETKSKRKSGRKSGGQVKQGLPRPAKRLAFNRATEYISNRREVTDTEKLDAIGRAGEALTEKSFMVVMRPTCCYKRFYLNIPAEWMHKHLPRHHKEVILRVGEKTWSAAFNYYYQRSTGGLAAGWKKFALENHLEEYDVCVFTLGSEKDDGVVVFDVEIFRVVEENSPLIPATC